MLKHIIMWQLKDELSAEEKEIVKKDIKEGLEGLNGKIPGAEISVQINGIEGSTADVYLVTTVEEEQFQVYANFPEHKKVAVEKIRPFVKAKMVMDYITD